MAELRYEITGMLEEEYKRRSCIEQAAIQQIQQLEVQVAKLTFFPPNCNRSNKIFVAEVVAP